MNFESDSDNSSIEVDRESGDLSESESYDSDGDGPSTSAARKSVGRRNIKKVKDRSELSRNTLQANKDEEARKKRIEQREVQLSHVTQGSSENKLVLDFDDATQTELIVVHEDLVKRMKDHQKEGVKFMWNCCYESVKQIQKSKGSGCILAHCMGLGKTFQVVALVHTLLTHPETKTKKVLICCPKSTVLNWINEFNFWISPAMEQLKLYNVTDSSKKEERLIILKNWETQGGVAFINYELFRILVEDPTKDTKQFSQKLRVQFRNLLITRGPDLIICDEGHVLRNDSSKLSKCINKISTLRRIVLTGTPMQNNLREYHCMMQFVKPDLLGSRTEYLNMFVNPILNGQYENSNPSDVRLMKERSFVLYKTLSGCIQRFDFETLSIYLPEKQEYVLSLKLKLCQVEMSYHYDEYISMRHVVEQNNNRRNIVLFADYHAFQRIFSHPYALQLYQTKYENMQNKRASKRIPKKQADIDDSPEEDQITQMELEMFERTQITWWRQFVPMAVIEDVRSSVKFHLLFEIIKMCEELGDKLLVFSNSLFTLESIEYFLNKINNTEEAQPELCELISTWEYEQDYFKLTGQTSTEDRARYCTTFNTNPRSRLFLISTRAGGLGINLTGANRAIIFDASWNPSYDVQSIFRIYRLGQQKPCFVYRFLASGTMEEKIYERQVTKQSISHRVVDEKQIARHYTLNELQELYQLDLDKTYAVPDHDPKDELVRSLLNARDDMIAFFHEHNSLLEHNKHEELEETEKTSVWTAYKVSNNASNLAEPDKLLVEEMLSTTTLNRDAIKIVLGKMYKLKSDAELDKMVDDLAPVLSEKLAKPDLQQVLEKEVIRFRNKLQAHSGSINMPITSPSYSPLTVKIRTTARMTTGGYVQRAAAARGVINSWGRNGNISFGSPDI